jgi:hypothetical protein
VEKAFHKPEEKPPVDAFVFVNAETEDFSLAEDVCQVLDRYGAGYALPMQSGEPAEMRSDLEKPQGVRCAHNYLWQDHCYMGTSAVAILSQNDLRT